MLARPGRAGPQLPLTRGSLKYMSLRSSMVNQRFRKPSVCCGSERACDWQVSRGRPASSWQQRTPEGRVQASPGQSPHSFTSATGHATRPSSLHTAPPSCSSRCPSPPWALDGGSGLTYEPSHLHFSSGTTKTPGISLSLPHHASGSGKTWAPGRAGAQSRG